MDPLRTYTYIHKYGRTCRILGVGGDYGRIEDSRGWMVDVDGCGLQTQRSEAIKALKFKKREEHTGAQFVRSFVRSWTTLLDLGPCPTAVGDVVCVHVCVCVCVYVCG
jgi:hypothetical protein